MMKDTGTKIYDPVAGKDLIYIHSHFIPAIYNPNFEYNLPIYNLHFSWCKQSAKMHHLNP